MSHHRQAVATVSAPWSILGEDRRPTGGDTDINELRQYAAVEACRQDDIDSLVISGHDDEIMHLTLVSLGARRHLRYGIKDFHVLGGASCTFLNAYRLLEFADANSIAELSVVTSPWHMPRLRHIFQEIATCQAHYLGLTTVLRFRESAWSSDPETLAFERRLAAEEPKKIGYEAYNLKCYRRQLSRWVTPIGRCFLPFPEVVRTDVPPPTLARLASIVTS